MSELIQKLSQAMEHAMQIKPIVGGFPVLAEVLRQAGLRKNIWQLPSAQALYQFDSGTIVHQGEPLQNGFCTVAEFNQEKLIECIRRDQAGFSSFPEFLQAAWASGVIGYEVDFDKRFVKYWGTSGESYTEDYPTVEL